MSPLKYLSTPFPELNALLQRLLADVRAVLGELYVGMYLHGSLSLGDFDPRRSDVDFLVAVVKDLPGLVVSDLQKMHAKLTASGQKWVERLEGSYIPLKALRRYDPADSYHPALRMDGSFDIDGHGPDWVIQLHVVREKGIVLGGLDPETLIEPVQPDELSRAARETLLDWWAPQLDDPFRLQKRDYQAYAVMTMCRALYTVRYGGVVSKPIAARWAVKVFEERWKGLIERALVWQPDEPLEEMEEVLEFIRMMIERASPTRLDE